MSGKKSSRLKRQLTGPFLALALLCPAISLSANEQSEAEVESYLVAARMEAEAELNISVRENTLAELSELRAQDEDLEKEAATKRALVKFVQTHDDSLLSLKNIPNAPKNTSQISRGNSSEYQSETGPTATAAPAGNIKINPLKDDQNHLTGERFFVGYTANSRREIFTNNTGYHSRRQGYL